MIGMSERKFQPLKTLFPKAFVGEEGEKKFYPLKTLFPKISERVREARIRGSVADLAEDYRAGMAAVFGVPVEWIREEPVEAWITRFTSAFVKPEHIEEVMESLSVEGPIYREDVEMEEEASRTEERDTRVFGSGSGKTRTM